MKNDMMKVYASLIKEDIGLLPLLCELPLIENEENYLVDNKFVPSKDHSLEDAWYYGIDPNEEFWTEKNYIFCFKVSKISKKLQWGLHAKGGKNGTGNFYPSVSGSKIRYSSEELNQLILTSKQNKNLLCFL